MSLPTLPKFELIQAPTPLHLLSRVSEDLGQEIWIKRDDLTGFAMGGNKGRKLEYLMAEAIARGAEICVTCGSLQSNFVRQLGAACAVAGIRCAAAVMALPFEHELVEHEHLSTSNGNVLLDEILGVDLRLYPDGTWDELFEHSERLARELEREGRRVYRIPVGGSSAIGAYAFYQAALELNDQMTDFDWIVTASSSGSTHTGLAYAYHGSRTRVQGIACDPEPEITRDFAELASDLDKLVGLNRHLRPEDFLLDLDYVGPGYGIPSDDGNAAIRYLAKREGIFLDPVYSGKAFAGLLAKVRAGELRNKIAFWHTGGTPSLFAMTSPP